MRELSLRILRQVIELGGDLGVEGVIIGPGKANPLLPMPTERLVEHFYRALDELLPLARTAGTSIFVENMPFAFLPGIAELLRTLDEYGDSEVGVVYDVANGHFVREDVPSALRACAPRLRAVHLSDTNQSVYKHAAVGLGTVDFSVLPKAFSELGFARRPILEIIAADPDDAIQRSAQHLYTLGVHPAPVNDITRTLQS
jgi:sugar phosphate isomerase/epimerase